LNEEVPGFRFAKVAIGRRRRRGGRVSSGAVAGFNNDLVNERTVFASPDDEAM